MKRVQIGKLFQACSNRHNALLTSRWQIAILVTFVITSIGLVSCKKTQTEEQQTLSNNGTLVVRSRSLQIYLCQVLWLYMDNVSAMEPPWQLKN
jgi:hypothetical protein